MKLNIFPLAGQNWDPFTSTTDPTVQTQIRTSLGRIGTFSPYFDAKLTWMPRALAYFDSYAIYTNTTLADEHPDWVLKDASGNRLYIPWGCSNGTCPQYAGDVSNPAFRQHQITAIQTMLTAGGSTLYGYAGVWLDDVNLNMSVSDGTGALVAPIDPRTKKPMLSADWGRYFAEYVELLRATLPSSVEILHNSVWYAGVTPYDPNVRRQMAAADYINIERGFGDPGLGGGTGMFSIASLMTFIDYAHTVGPSVVIEDYFQANQMYSTACYWLINRGTDAICFADQTPATWTPNLYNVEFGPPLNSRTKWMNVWRRDFQKGFVLVNEPGAATQTIRLIGVTDVNGAPVSSVTLPAHSGGVFLYTGH